MTDHLNLQVFNWLHGSADGPIAIGALVLIPHACGGAKPSPGVDLDVAVPPRSVVSAACRLVVAAASSLAFRSPLFRVRLSGAISGLIFGMVSSRPFEITHQQRSWRLDFCRPSRMARPFRHWVIPPPVADNQRCVTL